MNLHVLHNVYTSTGGQNYCSHIRQCIFYLFIAPNQRYAKLKERKQNKNLKKRINTTEYDNNNIYEQNTKYDSESRIKKMFLRVSFFNCARLVKCHEQ